MRVSGGRIGRRQILAAAQLLACAWLQGAETTWLPTKESEAEGPQGPVPAIESAPPGKPLLFGSSEQGAGTARFQPVLAENKLRFTGVSRAYVADFWQNGRRVRVEIEVEFDDLAVEQTVLRVNGVFELRLRPDTQSGTAGLEWIAFRTGGKPLAVRAEGLEAGRTHKVRGEITESGTLNLTLDDQPTQTAEAGAGLSPWLTYPHLYVGSSVPSSSPRPMRGAISRLVIETQE